MAFGQTARIPIRSWGCAPGYGEYGLRPKTRPANVHHGNCCINCQHVLPTLDRLEKAHPNELVVIGVHSAKFDAERRSENIEQAVLRHGIKHPVINDAGQGIWKAYGVRAWPTIVLIDQEGFVVAKAGGEFKFETVDGAIRTALPYYRQNRTIDSTPLKFDLLAGNEAPQDVPGSGLKPLAFTVDTNNEDRVKSTVPRCRQGRLDRPLFRS